MRIGGNLRLRPFSVCCCGNLLFFFFFFLGGGGVADNVLNGSLCDGIKLFHCTVGPMPGPLVSLQCHVTEIEMKRRDGITSCCRSYSIPRNIENKYFVNISLIFNYH